MDNSFGGSCLVDGGMEQGTCGVRIVGIIFKNIDPRSKFPDDGMDALCCCPQRFPATIWVKKLVDSYTNGHGNRRDEDNDVGCHIARACSTSALFYEFRGGEYYLQQAL